ncbi:Sphingosine kinase 2 [Blyttiomyces sp. JEL0837]|nr:Sphingosine kinase 2 [Blyttiomyces sp. JEL0837]
MLQLVRPFEMAVPVTVEIVKEEVDGRLETHLEWTINLQVATATVNANAKSKSSLISNTTANVKMPRYFTPTVSFLEFRSRVKVEVDGLRESLMNETDSEKPRKLMCDVRSKEDLTSFDVIAACGGDGLVHELVNGLLTRSDWEKACKIPVVVIPAGSTNRLATTHALFHPLIAALTILHGIQKPSDVLALTTYSGLRIFSHAKVSCTLTSPPPPPKSSSVIGSVISFMLWPLSLLNYKSSTTTASEDTESRHCLHYLPQSETDSAVKPKNQDSNNKPIQCHSHKSLGPPLYFASVESEKDLPGGWASVPLRGLGRFTAWVAVTGAGSSMGLHRDGGVGGVGKFDGRVDARGGGKAAVVRTLVGDEEDGEVADLDVVEGLVGVGSVRKAKEDVVEKVESTRGIRERRKDGLRVVNKDSSDEGKMDAVVTPAGGRMMKTPAFLVETRPEPRPQSNKQSRGMNSSPKANKGVGRGTLRDRGYLTVDGESTEPGPFSGEMVPGVLTLLRPPVSLLDEFEVDEDGVMEGVGGVGGGGGQVYNDRKGVGIFGMCKDLVRDLGLENVSWKEMSLAMVLGMVAAVIGRVWRGDGWGK